MINDLLNNVPAAPVETPPVSDPNPPAPAPAEEPEFEVADDGTITYADGYRIDPDGRHFDADGTEVPEGDDTDPPADPAQPVTPAAPITAATPPAEPSTPTPQAPPAPVQPVQPTGQAPVYTYQNCFSPEEATELARLDLEEPMRAQQIRFERWKRVDAYAAERFDAQVEALEQEAPELMQQIGRHIDRARRSMSVQQLQQPGIVNEIAARVVAQQLAADPKRMQDLLLGRAVVVTPAAPAAPVEKPAAPVIPPAQRMPKPRGVRRQLPDRNGAGQFAGTQSGLKLIMQMNPTMSEDEAREYMQGINNAERRRES